MNPPPKKEPLESTIQKKLKGVLESCGYYVVVTHGNKFQQGVPDLIACHHDLGVQFVEVKRPEKWAFTSAQFDVFPRMTSHGARIWVLTGSDGSEIAKLRRPPNWSLFMMDARRRVNTVAGTNLPKLTGDEKSEREIQNAVVRAATRAGCFVIETHGNIFQSGIPDLIVCHPRRGVQFVEVKRPVGYSFTKAQYEVIPKMAAFGAKVYVMTDDNVDLLSRPPNWHMYMVK